MIKRKVVNKSALDFTSVVQRRIYLDLDLDVVAKADERAKQMRLPRKRYIEALIERDSSKTVK